MLHERPVVTVIGAAATLGFARRSCSTLPLGNPPYSCGHLPSYAGRSVCHPWPTSITRSCGTARAPPLPPAYRSPRTLSPSPRAEAADSLPTGAPQPALQSRSFAWLAQNPRLESGQIAGERAPGGFWHVRRRIFLPPYSADGCSFVHSPSLPTDPRRRKTPARPSGGPSNFRIEGGRVGARSWCG